MGKDKGLNQPKLQGYLETILKSIGPFPVSGREFFNSLGFASEVAFSRDGLFVCIPSNEGLSAYNSFITECLTNKFLKTHASWNFIRDQLHRLIVSHIAKDGELWSIGKFEAILRDECQQWETVFPVDGIILEDVDELSLGKVTLRKFSSVQPEEYSRKRENLHLEVCHESENDKSATITYPNDGPVLMRCHWSDVNAFVEFRSAKEGLMEKAFLKLDEELNILRFCLFPVCGDYKKMFIGLKGTNAIASKSYYSRTLDRSLDEIQISSERTGRYERLKISSELLSSINRDQFDAVCALYKKEFYDLNDVQKRIRTAINWFGKAVSEDSLSNSFLFIMIAIEALISFKEAEIAEPLAHRIITLLWADASMDKKLEMHQRLKAMYDLRSKIVHAGADDDIGPGVHNLAMLVVMDLISFALENQDKFITDNDLQQYFLKCKLQGNPEVGDKVSDKS